MGGATPGSTRGRPQASTGGFFFRDAKDYFNFYPRARLQIDGYGYLGDGIGAVKAADGSTAYAPKLFMRRARIEAGADFFQHRVNAYVGYEFGGQPLGNANGKGRMWFSRPGEAPSPSSARFAGVETPGVTAQLIDVFINLKLMDELQLMVGQVLAPSSIEARTPDTVTSLFERSVAVRGFAVAQTHETGLTAWGNVGGGVLMYEVGIFGGDGTNRPQVDNRFDYLGRVFARPFARGTGPLKKWQIGVTLRHGDRDPKLVGYDYTRITTAQGTGLWEPTYTDSVNRLVHVVPSGAQNQVGGELNLPISRVELRGEVHYVANNTREAVDGFQLTSTERLGTMRGFAWYGQVTWWPLGDAYVYGDPGMFRPRSVDVHKPVAPFKKGLEVVGNVAGINAHYDGAARAGRADAKTPKGDITIFQYSLGVSYWLDRFVRAGVNYCVYHTPGSGTADNLAFVPGNTKGADKQQLAPNAHVLHELAARVAVQF